MGGTGHAALSGSVPLQELVLYLERQRTPTRIGNPWVPSRTDHIIDVVRREWWITVKQVLDAHGDGGVLEARVGTRQAVRRIAGHVGVEADRVRQGAAIRHLILIAGAIPLRQQATPVATRQAEGSIVLPAQVQVARVEIAHVFLVFLAGDFRELEALRPRTIERGIPFKSGDFAFAAQAQVGAARARTGCIDPAALYVVDRVIRVADNVLRQQGSVLKHDGGRTVQDTVLGIDGPVIERGRVTFVWLDHHPQAALLRGFRLQIRIAAREIVQARWGAECRIARMACATDRIDHAARQFLVQLPRIQLREAGREETLSHRYPGRTHSSRGANQNPRRRTRDRPAIASLRQKANRRYPSRSSCHAGSRRGTWSIRSRPWRRRSGSGQGPP